MKANDLLRAFTRAGKRAHLVGGLDAGAIVGLDLEGRWFAVHNGEVLNRVNLEAIDGRSTRERYLNPGGDGLWPAPEGTALGYQYSTGAWRVPPGLCAARFRALQTARRSVLISAEVDLVNNRGLGIPAVFSRRIAVSAARNAVAVRVVDAIRYVGRKPLRRSECLLAPWSLCQFDCGPGCEAAFPCRRKSSIWDLYDDPSDAKRTWRDGMCRTRTDGIQRYQIALGAETPWIEFRDPTRRLTVRRKADPLPAGRAYIDISDSGPDVLPKKKGVRYSIYSDANKFMEIEAVGGSAAVLRPGDETRVTVSTRFTRTNS
ncbi:MAG: hypothetical protein GX594_14880 [Pirellulaceae bacterium]|nr:hypothetical protein [Pirellulaceae bacterium]